MLCLVKDDSLNPDKTVFDFFCFQTITYSTELITSTNGNPLALCA